MGDVELWDVLAYMLGQAPLVAVAVAVLYVLLSRELHKEVGELEKRVEMVERGVEELGRRVGTVEKGVEELKGLFGGLEKRVEMVERGVKALESEVSGIGARLEEAVGEFKLVARVFQGYNSTLLEVLAAKGVFSSAEVKALGGYLSLIPSARSRYYTEEVRQRLSEIIKAVLEDRYTAAEVKELQHIAKLIEMEWRETGREDLLDYYVKLTMLIAMLRGRLFAEGKLPLEEYLRG